MLWGKRGRRMSRREVWEVGWMIMNDDAIEDKVEV